jgi:LysR family hydrogen peroxide-inducible transcriptional activator
VADARSFRGAAKACGVSQPSLSAQVAEVERQLGARIFERDRKRGLLVTPAGGPLLASARDVLLAADQLADAGRGLGDPLAGTLRLGVIPTIAPYLLPRLVPLLRRRHPGLTPLWQEEKTGALVSLLGEGKLEAALVALEAPLGDLEQETLGEDPFLLCVSARHWLADGRGRVALDVLAVEKLLLLDEGHCLREQALAVCSRQRAEEAGFRATSLPTLVQMVASNAGITLLPRLAAAVELERADIVVRRFEPPEPARTLGLVWRPTSTITRSLVELATSMRQALPGARPQK